MIRDPLPPSPHAATAVRRVEEIPALHAARWPDATALVEGGVAMTWRELEAARRHFADQLGAAGVGPGDRVMVVAENSLCMVALLFATTTLGAWVVNVNARLAAREIDAIRAHCTPRCTVFLPNAFGDARAHAERHDALAMECAGWGEALVTIDPAARREPVDADDPIAALVYTTGTTGEPKGVMLAHRNVLFVAGCAVRLRELSERDRIFGVLPLSHVYGLSPVCLGSLMAGSCIVLHPRFIPARMDAALREDGITTCQGVPAMYAKFLEHLRDAGRRVEAPALRAIYAGGSPLDPALKAAVEAAFALPLLNGYGLTEAGPTLSQVRPWAPRADCSVGEALPGVELRIVQPDGSDAAAGAPGELWARSPGVMKGYYRNAAATDEALRAGGWLATGDIASIAPDGALSIVGRLKELIIRSGFNVYPVEVEAVLNAHPDVVQSAVVGREAEGNEEVVAFVELAPGARADAQELLRHAAAGLAPYKRPSEIVILPLLPAAASGKVLKGKLKALAREMRASATPRG